MEVLIKNLKMSEKVPFFLDSLIKIRYSIIQGNRIYNEKRNS